MAQIEKMSLNSDITTLSWGFVEVKKNIVLELTINANWNYILPFWKPITCIQSTAISNDSISFGISNRQNGSYFTTWVWKNWNNYQKNELGFLNSLPTWKLSIKDIKRDSFTIKAENVTAQIYVYFIVN